MYQAEIDKKTAENLKLRQTMEAMQVMHQNGKNEVGVGLTARGKQLVGAENYLQENKEFLRSGKEEKK